MARLEEIGVEAVEELATEMSGAPITNILIMIAMQTEAIPLVNTINLYMTPHDKASILANDATVKDMEGAVVAYVADLFSFPAIFIKAVTDIVDGEKSTTEEFIKNLLAVTTTLDEAVSQVIDFISDKCLSHL